MRSLMALFLVLATGGSLASARIVHPWESVHIESGRLKIDGRMDSDGNFLEEFRIQAGTRVISVPKQELLKFPGVRLNTVEIEWNCRNATAAPDSQASVDQCEQHVSLRYDDSEDGVPGLEYGAVVTFVFSDGKFLRTEPSRISRSSKP